MHEVPYGIPRMRVSSVLISKIFATHVGFHERTDNIIVIHEQNPIDSHFMTTGPLRLDRRVLCPNRFFPLFQSI